MTSRELTSSSGSIQGEYGDDHIWISMKQNGSLVQVQVRVGLLGNENNSRRIHNAILRNL